MYYVWGTTNVVDASDWLIAYVHADFNPSQELYGEYFLTFGPFDGLLEALHYLENIHSPCPDAPVSGKILS